MIEILADRLITVRERYDLTQAQLAERVGVSEGAVAKWERGERTPSLEDLCRLSDALAVPASWLMGRQERGRPFTTQGGVNPPAVPHQRHALPSGWACLSQPGGCRCHCHVVKAGKLRSTRTPQPNRADLWTPEQDAYLRERLAAAALPDVIAAELSERFHIPRTRVAVISRAQELSISLYAGWTSSTQLRHKLGVSRVSIEQWRTRGLLGQATEFGRWPRYLDHEVEAFVNTHAGVLFDPRRVRDSRLKSLAETAAIVNKRRQA